MRQLSQLTIRFLVAERAHLLDEMELTVIAAWTAITVVAVRISSRSVLALGNDGLISVTRDESSR